MNEPLIDRIRRALARLYAITSRTSVDACVRSLELAARDLDSVSQSLNARANRRYAAAARLEKQGDADTMQAERAVRVLARLDALLK